MTMVSFKYPVVISLSLTPCLSLPLGQSSPPFEDFAQYITRMQNNDQSGIEDECMCAFFLFVCVCTVCLCDTATAGNF